MNDLKVGDVLIRKGDYLPFWIDSHKYRITGDLGRDCYIIESALAKVQIISILLPSIEWELVKRKEQKEKVMNL